MKYWLRYFKIIKIKPFNKQSELFRLKNSTEEAVDNLEAIRRENKNLQEEVAELNDSLAESSKAIHEMEKTKRTLEQERVDLQTSLEEAEAAVESEEAKCLRVQVLKIKWFITGAYEQRLSRWISTRVPRRRI